MKLVISLIIFIITISNMSYSQVIGRFGLKIGPNFSGLTTADDANGTFDDSSFLINFLAFDIGIYTELFPSTHFCVSTELHYNLKGERNPNFVKILVTSTPNHGEFYDYKYLSDRFQYISLQILPRYNFIVTATDKMYLLGGAKFDYRIGNYNAGNSANELKINNSKLELGGTFGFGVEYQDLITLEFRFEHNFSKTYTFSYGSEKIPRTMNSVVFLTGISLKKFSK